MYIILFVVFNCQVLDAGIEPAMLTAEVLQTPVPPWDLSSVVPLVGIEPTTLELEVLCSIP